MSSTVRAPRRVDARQAKPTFSLAPMSRRLGGALIDMVLLLAVAGVASSALEGLTSGITRIRIDAGSGARTVEASLALPLWLPLAVFVVLTAVYTVTLMATWGRTLGGWAMGIRCVRADTGERPGWPLAVRRWFVLYGAAGLLAFVPVIGPFAWIVTLAVGLSPLWDSNRLLRGYADYFGGDVVVMARGRVPQHR
jgi:hypothetical protein